MGEADNDLLEGLFGDVEVAHHLGAGAEIAAILRFEAALARVEARMGVIPAAAGPAIAQALDGLVLEPHSLVAATTASGVVVPGLIKALRDRVGSPHGDFVHWGATSQDATDTGLVLRLAAILALLEERLAALVAALAAQAEAQAGQSMAGRTRSQIAAPTTFGLRIAGWMAPLARCRDRLRELRPRLLVVQLGGATGTLSVLGAAGVPVMEALAAELGLGCPAKPWHVERDALVELANWLAMVCGLAGRIGADLILLGRTEAGEVTTGAGGGSSTMPQKQNPVRAEALVTLARATGAQAGLMQQALLQTEEREGSAWALEWLTLPPMLIAAGAGLRHANALVAALAPVPERMAQGLDANGGAVLAEALAFGLAARMPLPEAQALVKSAAAAQVAHGDTLVARVAAACRAQGLPPPDLDAEAHVKTARALIRRAVAAAS